MSEPKIGVLGGCGKDKWLGEANQDLANHCAGVDATRLLGRAGVADPVTDDEQHGSGHEAVLESAVDDPDGQGEDGNEREEEGGAEPVDCRGTNVVVGGRVVDDGSVGEPLEMVLAAMLELGRNGS